MPDPTQDGHLTRKSILRSMRCERTLMTRVSISLILHLPEVASLEEH